MGTYWERLLESNGCKVASLNFSERPCHKRMKWTVIKQDAWCLPLYYTTTGSVQAGTNATHTHIHTHVLTHTNRNYPQF